MSEEGTPQPEPSTEATSFTVPEAYKEAKWAQNIKGVDDLWSQFAGAQDLIGRRPVVPTAPENPDMYNLVNPEPIKDAQRDKDVDAAVKRILHETGVPKEMGESLINKLEHLLYERGEPFRKQAEEQQAIQAKSEKEFEDLMRTTFGDKQGEAQETFKKIMKDTLGESAAVAKLYQMDNDQMVPLMAFAKAIHDKYTGESTVDFKPGHSIKIGDVKSEFQKISQQKAQIMFDPKIPQHQRDAQVIELNKMIMKLGSVASERGIDLFS